MKVLFCSPYIRSPHYIQGGVVIWGANIVNYYYSLNNSDIVLVPISFDRKTYSESHFSSFSAFLNGIKELWYPVIKTVAHLRRGNVDAVHICTNTGRSLLKDLVILFFAKYYNVRGYVHFHCGTVPVVLKGGGFYRRLLLKVLFMASKGITMDMKSYNALKEFGIKNIVNLPNPVSQSVINQVQNKCCVIKKVPGRIVFVGHVLRAKGIYELIESCCHISQPDLHIIGKVLPEEKKQILSLLGKYKTNGHWIKWLGEIQHEKVLEEMLEAEIFAFPTYTEGFPNVILEAMACRCAIVTTAVGAIPEMLDIYNNPCGVCVEPQDTLAFSNALSNVYSNKTLIQEFAEKAQKRVKELYSIDKIWCQMSSIWSDE